MQNGKIFAPTDVIALIILIKLLTRYDIDTSNLMLIITIILNEKTGLCKEMIDLVYTTVH